MPLRARPHLKCIIYLKIEGFFRTRGFGHEFSTLLLQPVFRWRDASTCEVKGLLEINIGKIRGGRVVTFKKGIWGTSSLDWKLGSGEWLGVHH